MIAVPRQLAIEFAFTSVQFFKRLSVISSSELGPGVANTFCTFTFVGAGLKRF